MLPPTTTTLSTEYTDDDDRHHHHQQGQRGQKQHQSILRNKVVLSILGTETAERVAYFGFRAILVLYLKNGLEFSESTSVSLFASVTSLAYFSPLLGALLADSLWGRYQTIWRFGVMYSIGLCLLTLGAYHLDSPSSISLQDSQEIPQNIIIARSLSFVGLVLVCLGTGGIKPCVSAFGADQVVLGDNNSTDCLSSTSSSSSLYTDVDNEDLSELFPPDKNCNMEAVSATTPLLPISTDNSSSEQEAEHVREFFNIFYFCINVGALLSLAIIPVIRANYGFGAAFLIPSIFMIGALGIFISQRKEYKHRERDYSQPSLFTTLRMCLTILHPKNFSVIDSSSSSHMPVSTISKTPIGVEDNQPETVMPAKEDEVCENENNNRQVRQDAEQVLHLMPLMLFFPVFWMLYDQQGSVWTLQATRLNRHGLEPEQAQFLNPLLIMFFIPLSNEILYPWLEAKGFNIQPLRRMEYGMFFTAVAFFASGLLEYSIQMGPPNSISLAWQIPQIIILTVAEILVNVTGLEFAYSQAPTNMQALILAGFLCTTAIGDGFGSVLFATVFQQLTVTLTMFTCAVCMLVNLALFSRVARHWKPYQATKSTLDDDEEVVEFATYQYT